MTPKEKAKELVEKYTTVLSISYSKEFALIAIDEIIDLLPNINLTPPIKRKSDEFYFQYWGSVKKEIEKL